MKKLMTMLLVAAFLVPFVSSCGDDSDFSEMIENAELTDFNTNPSKEKMKEKPGQN